jgi:SNF2 family DNA or RNA helicase
MSGVIVERGKTNSRVIGLSGTPYDKDIYCENMYRFMGLLTQKNICSQHINVGMNYAGFQEIQEKLTRLLEKGGIDVDLHEADHRIMSGSARKKDLIQILHRWFFQHVVPHLSVSMTRIISDALFVPTNQHYAIDQENGILLWQYLVMLMKIYKYNPENDTIVMDRNTARSTLPLMKKIELVKVKAILIPKVLEVLRTRPKAKVVTFCTFLESLRMIREACEDYNPLTLQGNVLADARTRMISAFQKNESRVFNTNMGTGATSISLHGTNEDDEIHVFIIPTFSLEKMQQAVYRAYRSGSKGSVYVNVVYANIDLPEQRLGRAIMKKTKVYNELLFQQVENGMVFPGDYPIKKEGPTLRLHSITPEGQSIVDKYEREMDRLTRSTRRRSGEEE